MKTYFRVHPGGEVHAILNKYMAAHIVAKKAIMAWVKEKGLEIEAISGSTVYFKDGVEADKQLWKLGKERRNSPRRGHVPRETTVAGRQIKAELEALPRFPSWMDLVLELIGKRNLDISRINSTGTPGTIKNKDEDFYWLAIDDYWLPKNRTGLEEIKASEYAEADAKSKK